MATLTWLMWGVDILLGLGIVCLVAFILHAQSLYRAIILFVMFSLCLALIWVRLSAPDIALAEAAIGAGLTGALLISAYARLKAMSENTHESHSDDV